MSEANKNTVHPIFTKDPQQWLRLIHQLIEVTTEDGRQHRGYVYTVDPVSESIALLTPSSHDSEDFSSASLTLLPGAAIVGNVHLISETKNQDRIQHQFDSLFRPVCAGQMMSPAELDKRKLCLKKWLEQHRLPVELSSDGKNLNVAGSALTVAPPYTANSCLSTNEIILARIRTLIQDMPNSCDLSDVSS